VDVFIVVVADVVDVVVDGIGIDTGSIEQSIIA
jgi:hypothetical protein